MKKNVMMRVASALLVAVLMTTSVISGTFAKYVTADDAQDSARVAKWGVQVSVDGTLFDDTYIDAPSEDADTITVKSSNTDKLVAPGTKNETGITAVVAGTPEVDVKVVFEVKGLAPDGTTEYETVKDVFLKAGEYKDYTNGNVFTAESGEEPTFNLTQTYYPVKFTLTQSTEADPLVKDGTLAEVETALEALSTAKYDANTNLADAVGTLNLTWKWDYGTAADTEADPWNLEIVEADKADTVLANIGAGTYTGLTADTDYCLETGLELAIVVEQID